MAVLSSLSPSAIPVIDLIAAKTCICCREPQRRPHRHL
jgi:hypothetical protein